MFPFLIGRSQVDVRVFPIFVLAVLLADCKIERPTHLVYFGFANHTETPEDVLRLVKDWDTPPICPQWRATLNRGEADYQVLFGTADLTLIDRRGRVLYNGGWGPLFLPNGNPNGGGVNICKLTGE
jgi:hypothetical protein